MYKWLIGRCNNSGAASTCASTKEAATRASSWIILRVSCYHHCTINLFGDQSERDNHPTIDSLTYGGNPMITSRHATHHHKNVSKHSLSKSRSDIGHRVIYLATLCNTITLPLQVQCTSYLTNSISNRRLITILKIQTHEHVLPPPVPAPKRLPAELGPQRGGMQQALGLQELSNNPTIIAETHFYKALHDPLAQRFQNMQWSPRSCLHLNRCQTGYRLSWLLRLEEYDKRWLPSAVTTAMPCQRGHLGLQQSTLQDTFDFT